MPDVHHIHYAYQDGGGSPPGLFPVAWSCPTDEDLQRWRSLLRLHIRMTDAGDVRRPRTSLCYLRFNSYVALLRRVRGAMENRSDRCQALLAPAGSMTSLMAAGAARWGLWDELLPLPGTQLQPIDAGRLQEETEMVAHDLDGRARQAEQPASALLATVLRDPGRPVSAVAAEGWDGRVQPDVLLWGFIDVAEVLLTGTDEEPAAGWTFSTYESDHAVGDRLPQMAFLPRVGETAFLVSRSVVRPLENCPKADAHQEIANHLMREYAKHGQQGVIEVVRQSGADRTRQFSERVELIAKSLGGALPAARTLSAPPPRSEPVAHPVAAQTAPPGPQPARRPQTPPATIPVERRDDVALSSSLGVARSAAEAWTVVNEIARRKQIQDPRVRETARRVLASNDFWYATIRGLLRPEDRPYALYLLVQYVCSDEDLTNPKLTWEHLADRKVPHSVVETIGQYGADRGHTDQLAPWLGLRWLRERDIDPPIRRTHRDAQPALAGRRGLETWIRDWRYTPLALVGSASLALVMLALTLTVVIAI